jgi:tRNA G18 (ribose-2'-O)-methylase SpoU
MPFERVRSTDDPRVADYRGVADPELLRARRLFIAEGRTVVQRLLEDDRWHVRSVLVNEAARRALEPRLTGAAGRIPILICDAADFLGITGHAIHRGCLALVDYPPPTDLAQLLASARLLVVLEGVSNADNVGGVFRNAAAFGADAVILSPTCCSPLYRKAVRTSMAATLSVPFVSVRDWPQPLMQMRAAGFTLAAMSLREPSHTLDVFLSQTLGAKIALLLGSEGHGLTPVVEAAADYRIQIPIRPAVDSLNVAVASAIALHRLERVLRFPNS